MGHDLGGKLGSFKTISGNTEEIVPQIVYGNTSNHEINNQNALKYL